MPTNLAASDEVSAPVHRSGALTLVPALLVAALTLGVSVAAAYAPPATGDMAVAFPPWVDETEAAAAVHRAGGRLIGPTRLGNVIVVHADDPGFAARVGTQGALFTLAAEGIFCRLSPIPPELYR